MWSEAPLTVSMSTQSSTCPASGACEMARRDRTRSLRLRGQKHKLVLPHGTGAIVSHQVLGNVEGEVILLRQLHGQVFIISWRNTFACLHEKVTCAIRETYQWHPNSCQTHPRIAAPSGNSSLLPVPSSGVSRVLEGPASITRNTWDNVGWQRMCGAHFLAQAFEVSRGKNSCVGVPASTYHAPSS